MPSQTSPVMEVPLLDLQAQYAQIRDQVLPRLEAVLDSQQMINGPAVQELEQAVADYCGCQAAVGVSSGTDALLCALMALEIGPGDEVITTPYTFFATAGSLWRQGVTPRFIDIDPATFNLDPARIEEAFTERTRAIMPVHLFGQMADMDAVNAVAQKHGLKVIEDAAQAIGCSQRGRMAGSMGDAGCFSFFPSKNLGGAGDGGMITAQDEALAQRMRLLRNHGAQQRYHHEEVGGNFRLDTIQAAYLLVKLPHLDDWSAGRRRNAALYDQLLADVEEVACPHIAEGNVSIYNQYVIRAQRRDALREHLTQAGVGTAIYYPLCLHQQPCFASLGYRAGDFPEAERAAAETLALPIYPELSEEQIRYVAEQIRGFYARS